MTEKFRGRFSTKIDSKGRLTLPTRIKKNIEAESELVVAQSFFKGQPFLNVYTLKKWQQLESQIDQLPEMRLEVQAFQRFYLASGTAVEVDGQGRFLLPYDLRKVAKIKSDVILVGSGDRFEVWDQSLWNKSMADFKNEHDSILQTISDLSELNKKSSDEPSE